MGYTARQIEALRDSQKEWLAREDGLIKALMARTYNSELASEFFRHGLLRRFSLIQHAMRRVFETLPPDRPDPSKLAILDATVLIHAFVTNVYGAVDNMAHIWCREAAINQNGKPISKHEIGFGPNCRTVRRTLSAGFRNYLRKSDAWFGYLESYRHALAHRIPLYIPPRRLNDREAAEFKRLDVEIANAVQARQYARSAELTTAQLELGTFEPIMVHSIGEGAKPVMFHGQMVSDFATLVEIGENLIKELEKLAKPAL